MSYAEEHKTLVQMAREMPKRVQESPQDNPGSANSTGNFIEELMEQDTGKAAPHPACLDKDGPALAKGLKGP